MRRSPAAALLAALAASSACGPPGDTSEPPSLEARCEPTDNALRFRCTADASADRPATWTATGDDGTTRTFPADGDGAVVWGFPERTDVSWTVSAGDVTAAGAFRTGALPDALAPLVVTVRGDAVTEGIGLSQTCRTTVWLLILDDRGRVVWYEPTQVGPRGGGGYDFTAFGTVVRATADAVVELGLDGTERWRVEGFDRPLHHDVRRGGDHVYALNVGEHDGYALDGVYVLTDGALTASWDLADLVTPTGGAPGGFWDPVFPGSVDWSHGNSVWSDGHALIVSLRWQDAILALDGDPASPGFGTVDWVLTGSELTSLDSDFTWTDGGGFDGQHHATPVEGGVALFDNRTVGETSRALVVSLDRDAGTASERASWDLGDHCSVQGAAFPLADGGMLATCAPSGRVVEFGPTDPAPRFELEVACGEEGAGGIGGPFVARGYPVDLP